MVRRRHRRSAGSGSPKGWCGSGTRRIDQQACARRSERATRRGPRDASEPCRSDVVAADRHGAMRSGSVGDAQASPRPPASRAGRPGGTHGCSRTGRGVASATRGCVAAMRASRCGSCHPADRRVRGVANGRSAGVAVTRASRAGSMPSRPTGTVRCAGGSVGDAKASPRPPASRAGRLGAMLDLPHRSRHSERDTRQRGRDASEPVRLMPPGRSARAMRSERATRSGRRDASEPCRSDAAVTDRHCAMRSGSVGDAKASPRPPASRAGRLGATHGSAAPVEA